MTNSWFVKKKFALRVILGRLKVVYSDEKHLGLVLVQSTYSQLDKFFIVYNVFLYAQ
jgi:hypothetical protein